jgi:hypothetical protein
MGTAFVYQGRLLDGATPPSGLYDFSFTLWDASSGSSQIGAAVATNAVPVTNGVFTVTLNFSNVFDGNARWLAISVRTNSGGSFTALSTRQPLTPVPYALFASNTATAAIAATAAGVSAGAVSNAALQDASITASKIASGQVVKTLNGLTDAVTVSSGDGNIAVAISGNTIQLASTNAWLLTGNSGTTNAVLGTLDAQPLDLVANGQRGLHIEPSSSLANEVNVVGGSGYNAVASGVSGATIGGGGCYLRLYNPFTHTWSTLDGHHSIGANFGTIGGGYFNSIATSGDYGTIGGGMNNLILTNADHATVGGGMNNSVSGSYALIGGGSNNTASGFASTVDGGALNVASGAGATVGGGGFDGSAFNANVASGAGSVVAGGTQNLASGSRSTVGGGHDSFATNWYATVPGGAWNLAGGTGSFAAGQTAKAKHDGVFVWGDASTLADFASTAANQFLIRAAGGVGIGTNAPSTALEVAGVVKASGFQGQGAVPWQVVAGTSQASAVNNGYVVTNSSLVTVTLPGAPSIGDIVRVTGAGSGGWKIAQNAGQSILAANVAGKTTTVGTSGYLTGGQGAAIELQYIGNSQFLPLKHEGSISAN